MTKKSMYLWCFAAILTWITADAFYKHLGAGRDDVFMALWAGKSLGSADWFVNYDGVRQEISSSILQSLLLKIVYLCAPNQYYALNKLLGWLAGICLLTTIWFCRSSMFHRMPDWGVLAIITLLGLHPTWAYWTLGGLETPFYSLLLLLYILVLIRIFDLKLKKSAKLFVALMLLQVLLVLCRAEGFWVIGLTAILSYIHWKDLQRQDRLHITLAIGLSLVFLLGLFVLRDSITGAIFPNPVYAKVKLTTAGWQVGLRYLWDFYSSSLLGVVLGGVTIISYIVSSWLAIRRLLGIPSQKVDVSIAIFSLSISIYETFIVAVHGDWMEYHRFLAPTLALKFIFLGILIEHSIGLLKGHPRTVIALTLFAFCAASLHTELTYIGERNCSAILPPDFWGSFEKNLDESLIGLNCAGRRDNSAIRPFINQEMPKLIRRMHHLTILTNQGGYFPYLVREKFAPQSVKIVDAAGLLDLDIARADTAKSSVGNVDKDDIPMILSGQDGELSTTVMKNQPNLVYVLGADANQRLRFGQLGFRLIWDKPGALVYLLGGDTESTHSGEGREK